MVGDKLHTKQVLSQHNLPIPKTIFAKKPINIDFVEQQLGFPVIVKTTSSVEGHAGAYGAMRGNGVFLSETRKAFEDLIGFLESTKAEANIILQEYISFSRGRDLRVFVVGGEVIGCAERRTDNKDSFKSNLAQGGKAHPFPLSREIEWLATRSAKILGLDVLGLDLLFEIDGHFKICEANSNPGFKAIEGCYDISVPDKIFDFVEAKVSHADSRHSTEDDEDDKEKTSQFLHQGKGLVKKIFNKKLFVN
jgi:gamma-F420-2:alpha-L-glutamate ligase